MRESGARLRAGGWFQAAARVLLLGLLIEAPWAYGSTRFWTMEVLNAGGWACLGLHAVGLVLEGRRPAWPRWPVLLLGLLLAETAWMVFNARSYHDDFFDEFVALAPPFPALPGSWDRGATWFYLQRQTALAGIFLVAADTTSRLGWKRAVRAALGGTGASLAVYGLAQRALGAPSIFWLPENNGTSFFGAYRYHANAGAFLNLVWPMLVFLTVRSFWSTRADVARAVWSSALFLTLVGCVVNVSRAAMVVTVVLLALAALGSRPFLRRSVAVVPWGKIALGVALVAGFVTLLLNHGVASRTVDRWEILGAYIDHDQRLLAYESAMRMLPQAGWFGFGAGTFSAVFPIYTASLNGELIGFWKFAHEDYVQSVAEYGYAGAVLWGALLFGSMGRAFFLAARVDLRTSDRLEYGVAGLALLGVALHGLVDFPLQIASIQVYVMVWMALVWASPAGEERGDGMAPTAVIRGDNVRSSTSLSSKASSPNKRMLG
jgi:hypothetical protein